MIHVSDCIRFVINPSFASIQIIEIYHLKSKPHFPMMENLLFVALKILDFTFGARMESIVSLAKECFHRVKTASTAQNPLKVFISLNMLVSNYMINVACFAPSHVKYLLKSIGLRPIPTDIAERLSFSEGNIVATADHKGVIRLFENCIQKGEDDEDSILFDAEYLCPSCSSSNINYKRGRVICLDCERVFNSEK